MSDVADESEVAYHLYIDPDEAPVASLALRMLISDEAHEPEIRALARGVLARLDGQPDDSGAVPVPLTAPEMKITHTALRLLLNDSARAQDTERQILWRILEKLPDEHTIRAIEID